MKLRATLTLRNEEMIGAREHLGLSQPKLAKIAKVSLGFVMRCEKLDFPKRDYEEKVIRLATVLNVPVEDILPVELVGETIRNRYIVLAALKKANGSTSAELAAILGCDRYTAARRLPDLCDDGIVVKGEIRRCRACGRQCLTWFTVETFGPMKQ